MSSSIVSPAPALTVSAPFVTAAVIDTPPAATARYRAARWVDSHCRLGRIRRGTGPASRRARHPTRDADGEDNGTSHPDRLRSRRHRDHERRRRRRVGGVGGGTVTVTVGATGAASSSQPTTPMVSASNATPANRTNFFMALLRSR